MTEGLTTDEANAAISALAQSFPDAKVIAGTSDDGALFVVAIWTEPNGEVETRTVRRELGRYVLANTDDQPIFAADDLDEMLVGVKPDGQ